VPTGGGTGTGGVPSSGGSGSTSAPGTGRLTVNLTDSPFSDAEAVLVTFTEVSVHRTGGAWETLFFEGGSSLTCDLKQLQNLSQDVLAAAGGLTAGTYTQIRLEVDHASIHFDNAATTGPCAPTIEEPAGLRGTVKIPSGEVKLNQTFTIADGGATTILLDFDGDASIKQTAKGKSKDTTGSSSKGGEKGCTGNGNKPGCNDSADDSEEEEEEEEEEEDLDAGTYSMQPVLRVVSIQ
jgi:hypothetical protein